MTDDQIKVLKVLEEMIANPSRSATASDREIAALTAAIDYIRDTSEMLEAARNINGRDWGVRREYLSPYKWYAWRNDWEGGIVEGFDAALSAWRETQEKNK